MHPDMPRLKAEEARYRHLATGTKTSPEYRKEAMAKFQKVREEIYKLSQEAAKAEG